jgi:hypothetical protein
MYENQKESKRLEVKAKRNEVMAKIFYNLQDATIYLERIEGNDNTKKELLNIFARIEDYIEEIK